MGTHPIFESDFDCLTAQKMENRMASSTNGSDGNNQKLKPYDRLIHKKSLFIYKKINTNKRTWETLEEEENSMPLGAPIEAHMGCTDQEQLKWQFLKDLSEGD